MNIETESQPTPKIQIRTEGLCLNVRDNHAWANDSRTRAFYDELKETVITDCYESARESFWSDAEILSQEAGYGTAYSAGRSGGWLAPANVPHFLEYLDADNWQDQGAEETTDEDGDGYEETYETEALRQRDAFLIFARRIGQLQRDTEAYFIDLLEEAHAELEERREACIVRGEN